jgi:hypothetical protein
MKKFAMICGLVIMMMCLSLAVQAAEESPAITQGHLGFMAGGGSGGFGSKEVNNSSNIYLGSYYETDKLAGPMAWRFTANYFNYTEKVEEDYSSSVAGHTINVNTYRFLTGPSFQADLDNGWWIWDCFQVGTDWEDSKGFSPPLVLQNELMFGSGFFYNFLIVNTRITDDKAYQSVYAADQMMFRLTKWLAIGPEAKYQWFRQWDDNGDSSFVYEPSFGGLIRLGDNRLDQRWNFSVGYTQGDFMGGSWHADFWVKF